MKGKRSSILLILLGLIYSLPIGITLWKALSYGEKHFTLDQFGEFFFTNHTAMRFFWNSALYAVVITVISVIVSFPLGFLFAKVKFPGRDALFCVYIVVMLLPFQATSLPNYIQLMELELLHTRWALILPMIFSPFAVFLFRQFMQGIPDEILEYTSLETSSILALFYYIVVPLMKPAVIALSLLVFCESWNMVEPGIIFASNAHQIWPLSIVLTELPQDVIFAGASIYLYPILIIFIVFHDIIGNAMEKFRW